MREERIKSVVSDLRSITGDVSDSFGQLTGEQLNRKPSAESWSVAQCLDHLITINSLYFPIFDRMRAGKVPATFLEKYSPFSGFFGRMLIKSMMPENPKKMKTSKKAYPSSSEIDAGIVERFVSHQDELADRIAKISPDVELSTVITSPLAGVVTYTLDDCLTMLVVHEQRHVLQAKRVMTDLGIGNSDFGSL